MNGKAVTISRATGDGPTPPSTTVQSGLVFLISSAQRMANGRRFDMQLKPTRFAVSPTASANASALKLLAPEKS